MNLALMITHLCIWMGCKRLFADRPEFKRKRISIIGALNQGRIVAPMIFESYCNSEIFEAYVENTLVPVLKPGQTIIMDNASFHKSIKIRELIENSGCKLMFLPPYSPDLNPIEHIWFTIKHAVRKTLPTFWPNINDAIDFIFQKSGNWVSYTLNQTYCESCVYK